VRVRLAGEGHGSDEDAHALFAPQAKATSANIEQARRARLYHLKAAAAADAQLGHAPDPGRIAANLGDISPFAGRKEFDGEKGIVIHRQPPLERSRLRVVIEIQSQSSVPKWWVLSRSD
jgi:hypothetical protein